MDMSYPRRLDPWDPQPRVRAFVKARGIPRAVKSPIFG
jgi:hypothetical protein